MKLEELVERVAELEHEQWLSWARQVVDEVGEERRGRGQTFFVPYAELPEEVKEDDRTWARKVLSALRKCGVLSNDEEKT
jgi:hypothetical protein